MREKLLRLHPALRTLAFVVGTSVVLSGCIGGCIPIPVIEFSVQLLDDTQIPGLGELAPLVAIDDEFELPSVDIPSLEEIMAELDAVSGGCGSGLITIESVAVTKLTLTAAEGSLANLSTFEEIGLILVINGERQSLGTGSPSHDGSTIILEPANPPNLLDVLEGGTLGAILILKGTAPAKTLLVDLVADLAIKASLL